MAVVAGADDDEVELRVLDGDAPVGRRLAGDPQRAHDVGRRRAAPRHDGLDAHAVVGAQVGQVDAADEAARPDEPTVTSPVASPRREEMRTTSRLPAWARSGSYVSTAAKGGGSLLTRS
jgi:hypothetical protein